MSNMSLTSKLFNTSVKIVCSLRVKKCFNAFSIRQLGTSSLPRTPPCLSFAPISSNLILDVPYPPKNPSPLRLPNAYSIITPQIPLLDPILDESEGRNTIIEPETNNNSPKEAARLIVIRRKKMKKHKLKKFRKRTKYEHAKVKQRRELKKEKEFHAVLIAQCKEADAFSAEEYVANKIKEVTAEPPVPFRKTDLYKELVRRKQLYLDVNPKL